MKHGLITAFCILNCFLLSSCATSHKVNVHKVEQSKDKTFSIALVKTKGRMPIPYGDNVEQKKEALRKIQVKEIMDVISDTYGLRIDTESDTTIKIVKEALDGQRNSGPSSATISINISMMSENPYFGNKEYIEPGLMKGLFTGPSLQDEDKGDKVYITYGYASGGFPWSIKDQFYYEVTIKSDAEVIIHHRDFVAVTSPPMKGLFIDKDGVWNNFVLYADKIPEALRRDIAKKQ